MKKTKIIAILLLLLPFFIYSCKDDPITPTEKPLDTARYNWRTDGPIGCVIMRAWALDTNNIFFLDVGGLNLMKYDGNEYYRYFYSNEFGARSLNGVSNTEIYLGGWDVRPYEPTYGKPQLKRWDGNVFITIDVPDTFGYYSYVMSIYTGMPSMLWLGTSKGRVLKYQNGIIEETFIDTSQYIQNFVTDETGNLYFLAIRDTCNLNYTWCRVFISIFKLENTAWQKIFYGVYEDPQVPLVPRNLGDEIFASDYKTFYKFIGNDYQKIINIYGFQGGPWWGGVSQSDFICVGGIYGPCGGIFHWNGKAWSNENVQLNECVQTIINVQGKYVCASTNGSSTTYFTYGIKK